MNSILETGHFIWNFSAWIRIFSFSAAIFCLITYLIKSKRGGSILRGEDFKGCHREVRASVFEQVILTVKNKIISPWVEMPFSHILSMAVLFLLFMAALFSKAGMD